jgi:hypothetical protein
MMINVFLYTDLSKRHKKIDKLAKKGIRISRIHDI